MNDKKIKKILSISSVLISIILLTFVISGTNKYKKVTSSPKTQKVESMSDDELLTLMNEDMGDDERVKLELMMEDELERRHEKENLERMKESEKLMEKRFADEEKQKIAEENDKRIMALAKVPRELPNDTPLSLRDRKSVV